MSRSWLALLFITASAAACDSQVVRVAEPPLPDVGTTLRADGVRDHAATALKKISDSADAGQKSGVKE